MLAGEVPAALPLFKAALQLDPGSVTAQHHMARALFNLGRQEQALGMLQQVIGLAPDFLEARCSLAHVLRALARFDEAASQYQAVVRAAPGLHAAQFNLGVTELLRERPEAALAAFDQCLSLRPDDPEAWLNRGLSQHMAGAAAEAQASYRRVIALSPDSPTGHYYLGSLLNEQLRDAEAEHHLRRARELDPRDPDTAAELIGLLEQANRVDEARSLLPEALAAAPGHPRLLIEAAKISRRAADLEQARRALAQIQPQRLMPRDAQVYWFERGLLHDRAGECEAAISAFNNGHRLAARSPRRRGIDSGAFDRRLAALDTWLDENGAMLRRGFDEPLPPLPFSLVFLVGLPRSGTTLLDTVLDAQPGFAAIEEKPTVESVLQALPQPWLDGLLDLGAPEIARLRGQYVDLAQRFIPGATPRVVVDKLPLRFLDLPALRWLFPEAGILFVARHPFDVMLSNFMQQYVPTEAFIHFDSLDASARTCAALLARWRRMASDFRAPHHRLDYEHLVESPAQALEALGGWLDVVLDIGALDPARRLAGRGRIATNSYQQVAEPVYRRAIGRWKDYAAQLGPHLAPLADEASALGYPVRP
nr:tetratricopeptide repeat-containing sulfotransferase family protein [Lysobacter sp. CAU 1642]